MIYFIYRKDYSIKRINADGTISTVARNNVDDERIANYNLVIDKNEYLYYSNVGNDCIYKISLDSNIEKIAGGESGFTGDSSQAVTAMLAYPTGIAIDDEGNVYFSDAGKNNRIRRIDTDGIIRTVTGNGSSSISQD